jgi:hypothetical protein
MCTAKIEMHDNHRFPVVSSGSLGTWTAGRSHLTRLMID